MTKITKARFRGVLRREIMLDLDWQFGELRKLTYDHRQCHATDDSGNLANIVRSSRGDE